MHVKKMMTAFAAMAMTSACSGLSSKIEEQVMQGQSKVERLIKEVGQNDSSTKPVSTVIYEDGIWIAKNSIRLEQKENLPPIFNEPATFDRTVYSLSEFAERITLRSGIPAKLTPDAAAAASNTLQAIGKNAGAANSSSTGAVPGGRQLSPVPPATVSTGSAPSLAAIRIVYPSGTLKGLLDTAGARFGVYWKYVNGAIQFFYTDTRTYQINAIPGDSALTATVASGSTSGASGGGSGTGSNGGSAGGSNGGSSGGGSSAGTSANNNQNTAVNSLLSVFSSIEKSIGVMLSPFGSVVASPATGSLTVTDTPDKLDRISRFIEDQNKSLSRQVMINVAVLAVTVSNGDNLGINWNLVYGDLSRRYGIQNSQAVDPGSSSFAAAILGTTSKLSGTSLVINALAEQGKVRRETTASVVTLNNQPVPVQVAKQTSYLASSQTTITANVGATTSLNFGMVSSGFNMSILPHILNNGTVMLQFSTDISALRRIRTVSSNGSSIELPELDTRNFLQRVSMKSNETLVISGFEQTDDNLDRQGTGDASNVLLGGGYKAQSSKEVIVILVTPVTMGGTITER